MVSKALGVLCLLSLALGCSSSAARIAPELAEGKSAPYARFTLLSGEFVTLEQLRGRPAVVIFWASTCSLSPKVTERASRLAAKVGKERATFLAASLDKAEVIDEIKAMIQQRDMGSLTHAISGNAEYDEAYLALHGKSLPYIVLIDAAGKVVYVGGKMGPVEEYFEGR